MVKNGQERPEVLIPAQSCWAQRTWPSWELTRFSQPSAPMSQVQIVATQSIPPDSYASPSGEGALRMASVLSGRMGESVEKHLGSLFQALAWSWERGRCTPGQAPERLT